MKHTEVTQPTENRTILIPNEILEEGFFSTHTIFKAAYYVENDTLILKPVSNYALLVNENEISLPQNLLDKMDLLEEDRLTISYDESKDEFEIKPISKICRICEEKDGTHEVKKGIYMCEKCLSHAQSFK